MAQLLISKAPDATGVLRKVINQRQEVPGGQLAFPSDLLQGCPRIPAIQLDKGGDTDKAILLIHPPTGTPIQGVCQKQGIIGGPSAVRSKKRLSLRQIFHIRGM